MTSNCECECLKITRMANGQSAAKIPRNRNKVQRIGYGVSSSKVGDGKNPRVQSTKIIVKIYAELYRNI